WSPAPESSPSSRAWALAARRSSCTSLRRQSDGARRSRHVGRDNPWRRQRALPRLALGVAVVRAIRTVGVRLCLALYQVSLVPGGNVMNLIPGHAVELQAAGNPLRGRARYVSRRYALK